MKALALLLVFLTTPILTEDWPQFRGPHRPGAIHGTRTPPDWK